MSEIEVRELNENEYNNWDKLVENSPHGTIFHSSDWLKICNESFNKDLKLYGCFENDTLVGGCSLFVNNFKGILKFASSTCPMTPYGGIILRQSATTKVRKQVQEQHNLVKCLCDTFSKEKFNKIYITNSADFLDIRPFTWNNWDSSVRYAYYLNLEEDVEKNMCRNAKRNIKKTIESGVQVEKMQDAKVFYDLTSMVYERQNLKLPVSELFFEKVIDLLKSKNVGDMWVAKMESGEIVDSKILLWDNKRVYSWAGASNTAFMQDGFTYLLYLSIFKELNDMGFKEINLMTANVSRFTNFITCFNPELVPYYTIYKEDNRSNILKKLSNRLDIHK